MAVFFAVFNRQAETLGAPNDERKFKSGKLLPQNERAALESAKVAKVEAATVAECQEIVKEAYPGLSTGTVVCVTEAQYKES